MLTQRYTPTVAINSSNVQVVNPSNIHIGIVMAAILNTSFSARHPTAARPTRGRPPPVDQLLMIGASAV
jgi:hypothetical protein